MERLYKADNALYKRYHLYGGYRHETVSGNGNLRNDGIGVMGLLGKTGKQYTERNGKQPCGNGKQQYHRRNI
jgi:hypothetical protein